MRTLHFLSFPALAALLSLPLEVNAWSSKPALSVSAARIARPAVRTIPLATLSQRQHTKLWMSEDTAEVSGNEDDSKMKKKVKGRKKRLVMGYKVIMFGYSLVAFLGLVSSGIKVVTLNAITGPLLASGLAYILLGAAKNDRLASDTYKRLNLYLALYGALGLVVSWLSRGSGQLSGPFWVIPSLVCLINSIKGYGYGSLGWELSKGGRTKLDAARDILPGFAAALKSMFLSLPASPVSAGYWAMTVTIAMWKLTKLYEILQMSFMASIPGVRISAYIMRLAKLALLETIAFTLKDASDRDRLQGTTFIELNFMTSAVFAIMAVYHSHMPFLGGSVGGFSLFTGLVGALSISKKAAKNE